MKKILLLVLVLCSPTATAGMVSAEASFIPKNFSFITHIDAAVLQKIGCLYRIDDAMTASQLLQLLNAARDLPQDAVDPGQRYEIRNKVVFHFDDAKDVTVEFSQQFLNQPYLGASWNGQPQHLRTDVVDAVRDVVRKGGYAQRNRTAADYCGAM